MGELGGACFDDTALRGVVECVHSPWGTAVCYCSGDDLDFSGTTGLMGRCCYVVLLIRGVGYSVASSRKAMSTFFRKMR